MNVFDYIIKYSKISSQKVALSDGENNITYKQLYNMISFGQQYLKKLNIMKNSYVILKETNQMDFIILFLCLLSIETFVIPVSKDVLKREIFDIQKDTGAYLLEDEIRLDNIDNYIEHDGIFQIPDEEKSGILHMTSGSTGKPKYCIRTLAGLTQEGYSYSEAYLILPQENLLSTCPLYHSFALGSVLMSSLVAGSCIYTIKSFRPKEIVRIIYEHKINYIAMVPESARLICLAAEKSNFSYTGLRIALVGAGPISEGLYNTFYECFGTYLLNNYGSTETGGLLTRTEPLPFASVGKPMKGVKVKIKDSLGRSSDSINEGELWVKSEAILLGYWKEPLVVDSEGYFAMGDIVFRDSEGLYYIKGRIKSIIKIGGNSINPKTVESILLKFPNISDCVVLETKNNQGVSILKAVVTGKNIDINILKEYCKENIAPYMIPSILSVTNKILRNEMGKVKINDFTMCEIKGRKEK